MPHEVTKLRSLHTDLLTHLLMTTLAGDSLFWRPAHVGCDGQSMRRGATRDPDCRGQLAHARGRVPCAAEAGNGKGRRLAGERCSCE